jgi:hypothetical protein
MEHTAGIMQHPDSQLWQVWLARGREGIYTYLAAHPRKETAMTVVEVLEAEAARRPFSASMMRCLFDFVAGQSQGEVFAHPAPRREWVHVEREELIHPGSITLEGGAASPSQLQIDSMTHEHRHAEIRKERVHMSKRESSRRRGKQRYTFAEDTQIVAQTIINVVLSTREDVDPVPFVAALLEGYAHRVREMSDEEIRGPARADHVC